MNACVHTYTKPQTSSTRSRGLGRRIHGSVEDTKLSTNKQHSLSRHRDLDSISKVPILVCLWDASPGRGEVAEVAGSPKRDPRSVDPVHRRHALHITVVLSKAAHSGPSVCPRARAPCQLRVSCPGGVGGGGSNDANPQSPNLTLVCERYFP